MTAEQPFGFQVRRAHEWYNAEKRLIEPEAWSVFLPHQCDLWTIVGDPGTRYGESRADAAGELSHFIEEAEAALAALRAGEEFGTDCAIS